MAQGPPLPAGLPGLLGPPSRGFITAWSSENNGEEGGGMRGQAQSTGPCWLRGLAPKAAVSPGYTGSLAPETVYGGNLGGSCLGIPHIPLGCKTE